MPRTRPLTAAQRQVEQQARVQKIIRTAASCAGYRTMKDLAVVLGWNYNTLMTRLSSGFTLRHITVLADQLNLDNTTRAALIGSKDKCRYEPGYKGA